VNALHIPKTKLHSLPAKAIDPCHLIARNNHLLEQKRQQIDNAERANSKADSTKKQKPDIRSGVPPKIENGREPRHQRKQQGIGRNHTQPQRSVSENPLLHPLRITLNRNFTWWR